LIISGCILYGALKVRGLFRTEVDAHGERVLATDLVLRDGKIAATDRDGTLRSDFSAVGLDDANGTGSVRVEKMSDRSTKYVLDVPNDTRIFMTRLPSADGKVVKADVGWLGDPAKGDTPEQATLKTPDLAGRPRYVQIFFILDRAAFAGLPIAHMYSIDFGCGHTMIPSVTQIGSASYLFGGHHLYEHDGTQTVTLRSVPRNPVTILRQSRIRVSGSHQAMFADGVVAYNGMNFVQWLTRPMDVGLELHSPGRKELIDRFRYVMRRDCSDGIADCHPTVLTTPWSTGASFSLTPDQPGRWNIDLEYRSKNDPTIHHGSPKSMTFVTFVPSSRG
jgi:hypothetical protein